MAITDIFKASEIKAKNEILQSENWALKSKIEDLSKKISDQEKMIHAIYPFSSVEKFEVPQSFETLQNLWMKWEPSLHQTPPQIERQERASHEILSPLDLDPKRGNGHFKGEENDYLTTLNSCQCMDFQRRMRPCKHMYRLAYELDVYMIDDVEYNPNINKLMRFNDARQIIYHLSSTKKEILYSVIVENGCVFELESNIKSLISQGLLQLSVNKKEVLNHYKRDTLYSLLPQNTEIKVPKSIKKSDLIEIILKNFPEVTSNLEKFMVFVEPNRNIKHLTTKLLSIL